MPKSVRQELKLAFIPLANQVCTETRGMCQLDSLHQILTKSGRDSMNLEYQLKTGKKKGENFYILKTLTGHPCTSSNQNFRSWALTITDFTTIPSVNNVDLENIFCEKSHNRIH